ncbi:MAG TPA: hypothetical protein VJ140_13995 [Actinomycetota bacterium]|nr:hypothetical protein [Actinomycetota bacterium]
MSDPGEDLEAEAEQILIDFEECKNTHAELISNMEEKVKQYRRLRAGSIPLLKARTERLKMIELEGLCADAEAERAGAEEAVRMSMEALRLARERFGMVRSKMADRREEKGLVMRDGGYRGA